MKEPSLFPETTPLSITFSFIMLKKHSVPFPINDTPLIAKIYLKFFQLVETSTLLDHLGDSLGLALAGGRRQDVGDAVQQD
jgi:hypothetical protein